MHGLRYSLNSIILLKLPPLQIRAYRRNGTSGLVVTDLEVLDLVIKVQIGLGYAGRRKTFPELERDYYGIKRQEVE